MSELAGRGPTFTLPYVIDNRTHCLAGVLDGLLRGGPVHAVDIAIACFNVWAFELLQEALEGIASLPLLLGAEPGGGEDLGSARAVRPILTQEHPGPAATGTPERRDSSAPAPWPG
jgi:hypothetical protein